MWLKAAWGLLSFVVIQEGFEPPTHGLEGRCSIQLGYWTMWGCGGFRLLTGVITGVTYIPNGQCPRDLNL